MPDTQPTPPNLWRLIRPAVDRGWRAEITADTDHADVTLTRHRGRGRGIGPRLTAQWVRLDARGGWRFADGTYRDGYGGKAVRVRLRDLVAIVTETEHVTTVGPTNAARRYHGSTP